MTIQNRPATWYRTYRATRTGPIPHGTQNAYANHACRCTHCQEAHRQHVAQWRKLASPPDDTNDHQ